MDAQVEWELIRRCRGGSTIAFEPLVRSHEKPAIAAAAAQLGDEDEAADAVMISAAESTCYGIEGTTDIQVGTGEAQALKQAVPTAELRIVLGMNHVLKAVEADQGKQIASYADPTLPVVSELVDRLSTFIRGVNPRRP